MTVSVRPCTLPQRTRYPVRRDRRSIRNLPRRTTFRAAARCGTSGTGGSQEPIELPGESAGGYAKVELSELTERAAEMLESASASGDSKGIGEAVSLFDEVMSVCSRGFTWSTGSKQSPAGAWDGFR